MVTLRSRSVLVRRTYCKNVRKWLSDRYGQEADQPPIEELQGFVSNMFMGSFTSLGKIFDLNRSFDMWLIDKVFRRSGNRDRKDAGSYPAGFINVDEPYDKVHHAARYHFTQCPNAEFAKSHGLLQFRR